MQRQTVEVVPLDLRADVAAIHEDTRIVDLVFSTGADVVRYDWMTGTKYIERLSMDPKAIRLERLNLGAPLLDSHSAYSIANIIGAVEDGSAAVVGKQGRASVRFSKRADVEPFYQDVRDKIIRTVSTGYKTHEMQSLGMDKKTGLEIRLVTDWEPYEISMVPLNADMWARTRSGSGITMRASREVPTNPCVLVACGSDPVVVADADRMRRFRFARAARS